MEQRAPPLTCKPLKQSTWANVLRFFPPLLVCLVSDVVWNSCRQQQQQRRRKASCCTDAQDTAYSEWMCSSLTGDGRCPSSQMSVAFTDTPPEGRLPLKQTYLEAELSRKNPALNAHELCFHSPCAPVNQSYSKRRQQQRHTGTEEWVTRSGHHHHHHHRYQEKIPGAIKCADYMGPFDCQ